MTAQGKSPLFLFHYIKGCYLAFCNREYRSQADELLPDVMLLSISFFPDLRYCLRQQLLRLLLKLFIIKLFFYSFKLKDKSSAACNKLQIRASVTSQSFLELKLVNLSPVVVSNFKLNYFWDPAF